MQPAPPAWSAAYLAAGFVFRNQLERAAEHANRLGSWLLLALAGGLAAYIALKYYQRRRFIRDLRVARVTPQQLWDMLESGADVTIVDLRHAIELPPGRRQAPRRDLDRYGRTRNAATPRSRATRK